MATGNDIYPLLKAGVHLFNNTVLRHCAKASKVVLSDFHKAY
jgi:hypothetical protein